jgi:3-hydroxyisobutyrate dehydrogenase
MTGTAVAVLGTGVMGLPMAAAMLDAGLEVTVWNRTMERAQPLSERGAEVAGSPRQAVAGAQLVVTMLADGAAVHDTVEPALDGFPDGAVWIQMSTVGVDWTAQLARLAEQAGVGFVDAPVLGTRRPAEQGALVVLGSGPASLRHPCAPVLDAVGSRILWVGPAGAGSRLKLATNAWVLALTSATAESLALARQLGVNPRLFLEAIEGGPLDAGYTHLKGEAMMRGEYPVSFAARHAVKDAELVLAAGGGTDLAGVRAALDHLRRAVADGHGQEDMAVLYESVVAGTAGHGQGTPAPFGDAG